MLDYSRFNEIRFWSPSASLEESIEEARILELSKAKYALDETQKRIEMASKKQEVIDNLTYEKNLILRDAMLAIKEDIAQSYYNVFKFFMPNNILGKAWKYSMFKNQNRLKEIEESYKKDPSEGYSLKDYKNSFDFVINTIKDRLIPDKYKKESKLIEIIDSNYATTYEFTFNYKNVEFIVCIPIFENANINNYSELLNGYVLRFHESKYCVGYAFHALNPDEFKEKLEKWLDEKLISEKEASSNE